MLTPQTLAALGAGLLLGLLISFAAFDILLIRSHKAHAKELDEMRRKATRVGISQFRLGVQAGRISAVKTLVRELFEPRRPRI